MLLEPLPLELGSQYKLNVVKEVHVTNAFMNLGLDVTQCQNKESIGSNKKFVLNNLLTFFFIENCKSRVLVDSLRKHCGCLPFNIRLLEKVR